MGTIETYDEDQSASSRLEIWGHAVNIANYRPLVGGGFGVFGNDALYQQLTPEMHLRLNVHSIYFEVLGSHGYVGLFIFLLLGLSGLITARKIKTLTRGKEGFEDEYAFANFIQVSLIAYAVSGAFLNLAKYDFYYALLAMIALQYALVQKRLRAAHTETAKVGGAFAGDGAAKPLPAGIAMRSFLRNPAG
jgi:probable O-glycosylation ligase (exosortase A-associated)